MLLLGLFLWLWSSLLWLLFAQKRASWPFGLNIPQGPFFLHFSINSSSLFHTLSSWEGLINHPLCPLNNFVTIKISLSRHRNDTVYRINYMLFLIRALAGFAGCTTSPWCPAHRHTAFLQPVSLPLEMCQFSGIILGGVTSLPRFLLFPWHTGSCNHLSTGTPRARSTCTKLPGPSAAVPALQLHE